MTANYPREIADADLRRAYENFIKVNEELANAPIGPMSGMVNYEGETVLIAPNEHVAELMRQKYPGYRVVVSSGSLPATGGNPPHRKGRPKGL